jgi:hypothetical protein
MAKSIRTISYRSHSKQGPIPCLFVQGLFLKDLGFNLGDQVYIDYQPKKIVITALDVGVGNHTNG